MTKSKKSSDTPVEVAGKFRRFSVSAPFPITLENITKCYTELFKEIENLKKNKRLDKFCFPPRSRPYFHFISQYIDVYFITIVTEDRFILKLYWLEK